MVGFMLIVDFPCGVALFIGNYFILIVLLAFNVGGFCFIIR